jgi:hypothetical protein
MAHDDLPLHVTPTGRPMPDPPPPVRSSSSPTPWIVVGAGAVVVGALLTLWWMGRAQLDPTSLAPTGPTEVEIASRRPKQQPLELPPLADSDPLIRELAATLSRNPLLARLAATKSAVRAIVLAVVQIGDGKTPAKPLATLQPVGRLVMTDSTPGRIDPATYARWNGAVAALTSVSAVDAAQVYVNVKRVFDEAYAELGYPGGDFDQAIIKAIRTLDATPDPATEAVVLQRPTYVEYEDAALRGLLPVQKQLLLVGPENRRALMRWVHELARNLDLNVG